MKPLTIKTFSTLILTLCLTSTAQATLFSRLGGDALYDDVLDITWLSNANLADTTDFGVAGIQANGVMNWNTANLWIASMNNANHLGYNDWRLPDMDINNDDTAINCSGGGVSGCSDNEYGHLFWETGITAASPGTSPNNFTNLQSFHYWSGLESATATSSVWAFNTDVGPQFILDKSSVVFALAVRSGDVAAAVPVPAAVWLMGSALFGLAGFRRKRIVPTHP